MANISILTDRGYPLWRIMLLSIVLITLVGCSTGSETPDNLLAQITPMDDWVPSEQTFDGVPMVLVPEGCFVMGADNAADNEPPAHLQCFDAPFWIDKFEVTNSQFGSIGCNTDPNQPRNCVTWFEASAHCEARGARLPTEAEWEYAARSPRSLEFPWGAEYDASKVISGDSPEYVELQGAPVGSRPDGVSWVGALDMSGNVKEWTSSQFKMHPYDATNEDYEATDATIPRTVKGGSFLYFGVWLRGAQREESLPEFPAGDLGFRCARA